MLYERGLGMDISLAAEKMRVWFSFSLPNFNSCLKGPVRKVRPVRPKTVDPEKKKKKKNLRTERQSVEKDGNTQGFCLHVRDLQQRHLDNDRVIQVQIVDVPEPNSLNKFQQLGIKSPLLSMETSYD